MRPPWLRRRDSSLRPGPSGSRSPAGAPAAAESLEPRTFFALSFAPMQSFHPFEGGRHSIAAGDFNNDGVVDLLVGSDGYAKKAAVLIGSGDGNFGNGPEVTVPQLQGGEIVADFDGDGNDDFVGPAPGANIEIYHGNGDATFDAPVLIDLPGEATYAGQITAADLNNDTWPDLLVPGKTNNPGEQVYVLLNNGSGAFVLSDTIEGLGYAGTVVAADFNGDGNLDTAVTQPFSNYVAVALGDGAGQLSPPIDWFAGPGPNHLAAGDLDGDGRMDLFFSHVHQDTIGVLRGLGNGGFSALQTHPRPDFGGDVVAADFDRDGDRDLLLSPGVNLATHVWIYPNDGVGNFGQPVPFASGDGPADVVVARLNADYKPDIAFVNWVDDDDGVGVLLNTTPTSLFIRKPFWLHKLLTEGTSSTASSVDVTIELPEPLADVATLRYATANGTASDRAGDYTPTSGVLRFEPGETRKVIAVPVRRDDDVEQDEVFHIDLSDPVNLELPQRRINVTIADDDGPGRLQFERPVFRTDEQTGGAVATMGVVREGGARGAVSVSYATASLTATAGADYARAVGTLTFNHGQTRATFEVPVLDDALVEPIEALSLTLRNPTGGATLGGRDAAELRIGDDEQHVAGRYVFYNNSAFDGRDEAANADDDSAIATDKRVVLPAHIGPATIANLTSYDKGINGLMFDLHGAAAGLGADDLVLEVGDDERAAQWAPAPRPTAVTVRRGAGGGGSDRVTLTFPDRSIVNQWLRVIVLPTDGSGLSKPDLFLFGNRVAEAGNARRAAPGTVGVNALDLLLVRRNFARSATITNHFDFNRDAAVNTLDWMIARRSLATAPLRLTLALPGPGPLALFQAASALLRE